MTAVLVAHDGAAWLPQVADAVLDQTRSVQRVVAVDTGSRDRSGAVLASKFGQPVVFGMDRATSYGAAVARALAHRAASVPVPDSAGVPEAERVEWLWFLHDDCEPAPDALEQLLRGVTETSAAAVLGPKIRDWSAREVVLEAGVTLDTAARRVTGIEPREIDQGQHDGDRDTLAVSSAGMLVRRDVWQKLGGFDPAMGLFMEDIDFCWRVHAAGYRVRVITDAVAYHVQASARHRRAVSVGRPRMLDRRNGLLTLLGNLPLRQMLPSIAGNLMVSLLRITFFLLAKRLAAALDEVGAVVAVLGHPLRLLRVRRRRSRGRRAAYSRVRADLPPGRSVRRLAEFAATMLRSGQQDTVGSHHASADPTEDDSLLTDNGLARRLLTSPSVLSFAALLAIALMAGRSLIGSGPLGGGSLVPAWGGASDIWQTYIQAFHPVGIGSAGAAPPYLAVIAALATLLGGKAWLAIDVLLIGCAPLAGMTAMLAVRRVTRSKLVRTWAAMTYALLPVAMGIVAGGRFGSAVAFVLLPLIVLLAGRVVTGSGPQAGRAAWGAGLLVAIGAAFVPLLWLIAVVAAAVAALALRTTRPGALRNLAVVVVTAPVLLLPWTLTLLSHPAMLFLEAGLPQAGTPPSGLAPRDLLLLSPGGPGVPPYWVTGGLAGAAIAALFVGRRRKLVVAGWGVALTGMLVAIGVSRATVVPADGGSVIAWAGLPLALAATGLLLAGAAGADALGRILNGRTGWRVLAGGRGLWAALIAAVACSAPVLGAASWLGSGVTGPVHPVTSQIVPELVAVADGQSHQVRTLVLRSVHGRVSYLLLRGPSPNLADAELIPPADAQRALARTVAALITPGGGLAVNQSQSLAGFDIGYVLVQAPVDPALAGVLDNVAGLRPYSVSSRYDLWQLVTAPARVTVVEPNGTVVPVASGPAGVSGAAVPAAGGTLMLAEPAGGWSATVNGRPLAQVPSPAGSWAQAFRLPPGGGTLQVAHSGLAHDGALVLQLLAFLVLVGLALPGIRVAEAEGQHAAVTGAAADAKGGRSAGDPDAGDEPGEATDAGRDGRRVAALAGAGSARSARSARALVKGRAGVAGRGRSGRGAGGRGRAGRDTAGSGKAAGSGREAAGRRGSGPVRSGPGTLDALGDDEARVPAGTGRRGTAARVQGAGREVARRAPAGAWPYEPAADQGSDELTGGPQSRAWPYLDDDDLGTAAAGTGRTSRAPRSPSGGAPPSSWAGQALGGGGGGDRDGGYEAGDDGSRGYGTREYGTRGVDAGDQDRGGRHRDGGGSSSRSPSGPRPYGEDPADLPGRDGLRPGQGRERVPSGDEPVRRGSLERSGWSLGAGRPGRSGRSGRPGGRVPDDAPEPRERPGRAPADPRGRGPEVPSGERWDSDLPGGRDAPGGRDLPGRRGAERSAGLTRSRPEGRRGAGREAEWPDAGLPGAGWPDDSGGERDPLARPASPGRAVRSGGRRNVWRPGASGGNPANPGTEPDADASGWDTGGWDAGSHRRTAPEPEYEGDSW